MSLIDITKNLHDDQNSNLIKSDNSLQINNLTGLIQFVNSITGTSSNDGSIIGIDSDGKLRIENKENSSIYMYTNNIRRLVLNSNGYLGIGDMDSAAYHFTAIGNSSPDIALAYFYNTNAVNGYGVAIRNSVDSNYALSILNAANAEVVTINGDGKTKTKMLNISAIPTSASGLSSGDVWSDSGTLKIVGASDLNKVRSFYDLATGERGTQIKMINKTGANTVKGSLVRPSTTTKAGFQLVTSQYDTCNVVYEAGIADGAEAWVWCINSVCEMLFLANDSVTGGDLVIASATAGFALRVAPPPPPPTDDTHFKEVGHAQETKTSTSNFLCLVNFHTN